MKTTIADRFIATRKAQRAQPSTPEEGDSLATWDRTQRIKELARKYAPSVAEMLVDVFQSDAFQDTAARILTEADIPLEDQGELDGVVITELATTACRILAAEYGKV